MLCCVHTYIKCYTFLLDWVLYHYVMLLSPVKLFVLKSILSDISIATQIFCLYLYGKTFKNAHISVCVSLQLNWRFCRQNVYGSFFFFYPFGDGQGSLACCTPRGHIELDMTERLNWTELNRMGRTRDLFKKIRDTKGMFNAKMDSIKDRNGMDLTEAKI